MLRIRTIGTLAILLIAATVVWGEESATWTRTVAPGESIQEALDAAPAGGVIYLGDAVWEEHLTIGKSLTVLGWRGGTTIRGRDDNVPVIRVHASSEDEVNVVLVGLTLTGGQGWDGPGLFVGDTAQVTVTDSAIQGNGKYGIHARDSAQVTILHSTVGQNGSTGIFVSDSALAFVASSAIEGNAGNGISMEGFPRIVVASSIIARNGEAGVYLRLCARAAVVSSTIAGNKYGFTMDQNSRASLADSALEDNRQAGIALGGSAELSLERCEVLRNGGYGVALLEQRCFDLPSVCTGYITGYGNTIPGPEEEGGNKPSPFCPEGLSFLISEDGGALDLRD